MDGNKETYMCVKMQNGIYYKEINTGIHSDINPNFSPANELVAFNREKINYTCEGVDLILKDRHKYHGGRSDWDVQNGNQAKWSRKNITTTMERFEPTGDPPPPPPSYTFLDYGLAATVVASIKKETDDVKIVNPFNGTSKDIESLGAVGSVDHVYSYAYYEPRVVKCNSNIFHQKEIIEKCKNEQISSRRNVSKGFRLKASSEQNAYLSLEDRHSYTTHYGTTENLYEEVNEKNGKHVLCDNHTSISANSVKEEFLQVQRNHFRVIEELNLSLETFIMPPNLTLNNIAETAESIVHCVGAESDLSSAVETSNKILPPKPCKSGLIGGPLSSLSISGHRRKFSSTSLEDVIETFQSMDLKDNSQNSSNNVEFDEEDLDSGFSGSVISSGASYNESLRYNKSRGAPQTRSNAFSKSSCCSSPPSNEFSTKNNVTSQQSTSVTNKRCCENLLPKKKGHEITSFNSSHRFSDMHHLYIRSTPEALSTENS
ncbi:uncharacterized protein LOC126759683 isoform X1 [Bactrocera neohumeralis]|uniref:uncharacterized protein LOC126759683 isoform X1 n=2 Tax=Bactrocera neohumeralis TaxID=98809 RepID=UPI002165519B|nr:uncharacterized protein LOC126759683 isoform X1 [Bactrocera neohumeralis]XP_050330640.1 uncharacterized protein LOC126759683 isoform X1 [Bactrocera neohumeralis]